MGGKEAEPIGKGSRDAGPGGAEGAQHPRTDREPEAHLTFLLYNCGLPKCAKFTVKGTAA